MTASGESEGRLFTRGFVLLGAAQLGQNLAILMVYTCIGLLVVVRLGLDAAIAGALISGLFVTSLLCRLVIGGLVDRFGTRSIGLVGACSSAAGSLVYAVCAMGGAGSISFGSLPVLLIPATLILGFGYASSTTSLTTQLAHIVPPARRAEGVSYYGVFLTAGAGIGSGTGYTLFVEIAPWMPFVVAGMSYLAVATVWLVITGRRAPAGEARRSSLGFERSVLVPAVAMACVVYGQATTSAFVPVAGRELGIGNPGVYFIAFSVAALASRTLVARLADRRGRLRLIVPAVALQCTGLLLLSATAGMSGFALAGLVVGAGVATLQSALQTVAIDLAPQERRGSAMATFGASFDAGVIVGSIIAGQLVDLLGFGQLFRLTSAVPVAGVTLLLISRKVR